MYERRYQRPDPVIRYRNGYAGPREMEVCTVQVDPATFTVKVPGGTVTAETLDTYMASFGWKPCDGNC